MPSVRPPAEGHASTQGTKQRRSCAGAPETWAADLDSKTVVDVSNPLDFSPRLVVPAAGSVAEQLQLAFPRAHVVKTLNTVMTDPRRSRGRTTCSCAGTRRPPSPTSFGWTHRRILDLGGLSAARGVEPLVLLWISLGDSLRTADFDLAVLR
ncbi:hypothetical protein FAF44_49545 [Nonomuraea sp. MG754425]|uniref:hypothetical protein n=1 Tax=Nonomuraea sp. MG754425 TaxID=2570319 RepID=UPI001F272968|nr:hypothetical protein [Nonomuraea sp. MG754425]MCF6476334.1 hypothetical protein [Nonomuraea sp. MG754425]